MSQIKNAIEYALQGKSARGIARLLPISRNTASEIIQRLQEHPLNREQLQSMTDSNLEQYLFPEKKQRTAKELPNFKHIYEELKRKGVTLQLLWRDYVAYCQNNGLDSYGYSMFCAQYNNYVRKHELTSPLIHQPGAEAMTDWAGASLNYWDAAENKERKARLFVGVLPFSMYSYIEAFPDFSQESWCLGHMHMMEYFGGAPVTFVPDNLKTGVITHKPGEMPVLNPTYYEMAEHYDVAVNPTRPRAPKDKAAAESTVNTTTTMIIAPLRDTVMPGLDVLNIALRERLDEVNAKPFQKRSGSRLSCFMEEEKDCLRPLPEAPFEIPTWYSRIVQKNCHVQVNKKYYSAPYTLVGEQVTVRLASQVRIFHDGVCVSEHPLNTGKELYSTIEEHLAPEHRAYRAWTPEYFLRHAEKVGPSTKNVVQRILDRARVPEQAYRTLQAILHLQDSHSVADLENACLEVLLECSSPSYGQIKACIEHYHDTTPEQVSAARSGSHKHAATRGGASYRRKAQED